MRLLNIPIYILTLAILTTTLQAPASADVYITYNDAYSDGTPEGEGPWMTALFRDTSNGVLLTLSTSGLVDTEFLSNVYFAFNPAKDLEALTFTHVSGIEFNDKKTINWTKEDGFKNSGVVMDIRIPYDPRSDEGRFTADLTSQIMIAGVDDLLAEDFNYLSDNGFVSKAHIQSIGENGDSAWIGGEDPPLVPEPSTLMLVAMGLLLLPFVRRRTRQ